MEVNRSGVGTHKKKRDLTPVFLTPFLWLMPLLVMAQTAYVTDVLTLGLHEAQDTSDAPFRTLISGSELQILTRVPNYSFVETQDGAQGWVRSAFLVEEKPARLRVAEVEAALKIMREELESAQQVQAEAEQETARIRLNMQSGGESLEAVVETIKRLEAETEAYEQRIETYRGSIPRNWVIAALVAALAIGFLAGMWCLDALIRRRHGGFRTY